MNREVDEDMRNELREETETALRVLCAGRNYREWTDEMVEKILPEIEYIVEGDLETQEEDVGRLGVDVDMVITAMMMALCKDMERR